MNKKLFTIVTIICCAIIGMYEVKAEDEAFFTSQNGVSLTRKEYEIFTQLYGETYTDNLTQLQYDFVNDQLDIENRDVQINSVTDNYNPFEQFSAVVSPQSTYVITAYKKLAISASCAGGSCNVVMVTQWLQSPAVRSYDVFGVRFNGTISTPGTKYTLVETNESSIYCGSYVFKSNGHGCSIKLSETANSFYITQIFATTGSGRVYGSYQHATTIVSKGTSQKYNINASGLGDVFDFYGTAWGVYDYMNGVYIDI